MERSTTSSTCVHLLEVVGDPYHLGGGPHVPHKLPCTWSNELVLEFSWRALHWRSLSIIVCGPLRVFTW